MPSVGFDPSIPKIKQVQTYALDRTATGNSGITYMYLHKINAIIQ
jgi:hypothetical protein